ncbi:carbonic anhydrase [Neobacillus mesonae]|uniref:carbonic anhydrase n=1 Tax=Neobacillus mesonae TaxID=1193713 RepID=UPI002572E7D5|nr:carbonic anhydrase [Neobacillus mesonae]MED4202507.1 carbonic anhydrase [Neobacillus mesonae]
MQINAKKKILLVSGMEQEPGNIREMVPDTDLIVIQSYGSSISPFGDLMRDLIIAVYQEGVDEIFVVVANKGRKGESSFEMLKKLSENKAFRDKIQTLDYLFKNCMPEFPESSLMEWLAGDKETGNGGQSNADIIRNHPLIPSHIKVTELMINKNNKKAEAYRV